MKKYLLLFLSPALAMTALAQTSGPNNPASAAVVPNPSCLGCQGSVWNNETDVFLLDNNVASVGLMQAGQCFQSTCYFSRYLYAYNFGFALPGNATITGITVEINHQSGNINSATDSTVRLIKTTLPVGMNKASTTPWPITAAYASYGNSTDLWGDTWTPMEINAANFGVYLKVYNQYTSPTTPMVNHIRITIDYNLPSGIHMSQTSSPAALSAYQNENDLSVTYMLTQASSVSVGIYNLLGERQYEQNLSYVPVGSYTEKFNVSELPAGIYFVKLSAGASSVTKKVLITH